MKAWINGLRGTLLLLVVVPTSIIALVAATGIYAFTSQNSDLVLIGTKRLPKIVDVLHLRMNNHAIMRYYLQALQSPHESLKRKEYTLIAESRMKQYAEDFADIDKFQHSEVFERAFAPVRNSWKNFQPLLQKELEFLKQDTPKSDELAMEWLHKSVIPVADEIVGLLKTAEDASNATIKGVLDDAQKQGQFLYYAILAVSILGGAFSFGIGLLTASRLANSLSRMARRLSDAGSEVTSASTEIATCSLELSESATEQAASLEETATALEEINAMIAKSSDSSQVAEGNSVTSQQKAEQGQQAVEQMLVSINEISKSNAAIMNQVNAGNLEMAEIVRVIQEIGTKTKVINDIVFQTKLLSFNASVEAARAGEQGKGFAVVAEEVGNLAQMSGNAAKEITEMLEASVKKVEKIVYNTKSQVEGLVVEGKQKVEMGVSVARSCVDLLSGIVDGVSGISKLAQEISLAGKEQAQGVGEINKAMHQLEIVTQKNSTGSRETSLAAEKLKIQAQVLTETVNDLVDTVEGKHANGASKTAHSQGGRHGLDQANMVPLRKKIASSQKMSSGQRRFQKASGFDGASSHDNAGFDEN